MKVKIWRPGDKKAVALIKVGLWSGILVWMAFFVAYGVTIALRLGRLGPNIFSDNPWGHFLSWVAPVWVIFTSLLVCIYVSRFVVKKLGGKKSKKVIKWEEKD